MIRNIFRSFKRVLNIFFDSLSLKAIKTLPSGGAVTLIDIGAAGEIEPRWKNFSKNIKYVGFEPDARSRETLQNNKNNFLNYQILPFALSNSNQSVELNLCREPKVSSLYHPNNNFLNRFPNVQRFEILKTEKIECSTLDEINLPDIDFIKIDIQGAELNVILGANHSLDSALGLEVEVEFLSLYKDQPLFGDVCKELSTKGFEFIDFVNLARWQRKEFNNQGQCIFGDALFLKTPEYLEIQDLPVSKITSYLSILIVYQRFDLVQTVLEMLSPELRIEFKSFEIAYKKLKIKNNIIRKISFLMSRIIALFGSSYRLHLIE
jgi:FkbM family methyltransferase